MDELGAIDDNKKQSVSRLHIRKCVKDEEDKIVVICPKNTASHRICEKTSSLSSITKAKIRNFHYKQVPASHVSQILNSWDKIYCKRKKKKFVTIMSLIQVAIFVHLSVQWSYFTQAQDISSNFYVNSVHCCKSSSSAESTAPILPLTEFFFFLFPPWIAMLTRNCVQ